MTCKGCFDKSRVTALGYLTALERRDYLLGLGNAPGPRRRSMELLALAMKRAKADIILCHACGTRCGSEGDLQNWNKVRGLNLCGDCYLALLKVIGGFCCCCLITLEQGQPCIRFKAQGFRGRFFLCMDCCPTPVWAPALDLAGYLGGQPFVPELLCS